MAVNRLKMKAKYGAIVTSGSGKLNGSVCTTSLKGSVFSRKRAAKTSISKGLQAQNIRFGLIRSTWNNLTSEQKQSWELNEFKGYSSFSLFSSINLPLLLAGLSLKLSFTEQTFVELTDTFNIYASFPDSSLILYSPVAIPRYNYLMVYATKQHSQGVRNLNGKFRYIGVYSDTEIFPINLYANYCNAFSSVVDNSGFLSIKLVMIDSRNGSTSEPLYITVQLRSYLQMIVTTSGVKTRLYRSNDSGASFNQLYEVTSGTLSPACVAASSQFGLFAASSPNALFSVNLNDNSVQTLSTVDTSNLSLNQLFPYKNLLSFPKASSTLMYKFNALTGVLTYSYLDFTFSLSAFRVYEGNNKLTYGETLGTGFARLSLISDNAVLLTPSTPGVVGRYFCTSGDGYYIACTLSPFGIYKLSKDLQTATLVYSSALNSTGINAVYCGGGCIMVRSFLSDNRNHFYKSTNYGATFMDMYSGTGTVDLQPYAFRSGNNIFVPMRLGYAGWASTDGGASYTLVGLAPGVASYRSFIYVHEGLIYACALMSSGNAAIYVSTNFGFYWSKFYEFGFNTGAYFMSLIPNYSY